MCRSAYVSCRCGALFDDDLALSGHRLRSVHCVNRPEVRTTSRKAREVPDRNSYSISSSAPQKATALPWIPTNKLHGKLQQLSLNAIATSKPKEHVMPNHDSTLRKLSPHLFGRDSWDTPLSNRSDHSSQPWNADVPSEINGLDSDSSGDEAIHSTKNMSLPCRTKRASDIDNSDLRARLREDEVIENAEKVLSLDDASPEEMLEAFTRLMDINADRAGMALTNRIMNIVLHPNWTMKKVASLIRDAKLTTVAKIREKMKKECEAEMEAEGFVEVEIENPEDDQQYTVIWVRDSLTVLKNQLEKAVMDGPKKNFHKEYFVDKNSRGEQCISHPMTGEVARTSLPLVKQCVMAVSGMRMRSRSVVSWTETGDDDTAESCIAMLQFYSDASSMTLSTNSLSFYPGQVCVLNFDQKTKDQMVASGEAVFAYFSTDKTWRRRVDKALEVQRGFDGDDDSNKTRSLKNAKGTKATIGQPGLGSRPKDLTAFKGCFEVSKSVKNYAPDSDSDEGTYNCADQDSDDDDPEVFCGQDYLKRNLAEEIESQRIFAAMFRYCTDPIKTKAVTGLIFRCSAGKLYKAHLPLVSYVADSPEINHVACVKKGYCHKCFCEPDDLNGANGNSARAPPRDFRVTKIIHDEYELARSRHDKAGRNAAMQKFNKYHVHPMKPAIADWPFSHLPGLGCYDIFRFDHMHSHPLGLCKHLLKALHRRANDKYTLTNNRTKFDQESGTFKWEFGKKVAISKRSKVALNGLNWLLVSIDRDSPLSSKKVDHTRGKKVGQLNSVFTEEGIVSMLEAKDYKSLTEVLPFLAALLDRLVNPLKESNGPSRNSVKPLMTELAVAYTEMDAAHSRRGMVDKNYTKADLNDLHAKKRRFASIAVRPEISKYQTSHFSVEKFHKSITHSLPDIIYLGFYAYYDSSVFESSHIVFKRLFRATSQRISTGMREATQKLSMQSIHGIPGTSQLCPRDALVHSMVYGMPSGGGYRQNPSKHKARQLDQTTLITWGTVFSLGTLQSMMNNVEIGTKNWKTFLSVQGTAKLFTTGGKAKAGKDYASTTEFVRSCGGPNFLAKPISDILHKLSSLPYNNGTEIPMEPPVLTELYHDHGYTTRDVKIKVVSSAFVPSVNAPVLADVRKEPRSNAIIRLRDNGDRHLSRIISANSWSHGQKRRKDCVLVEGIDEFGSGERVLWAAKVLALIIVKAPKGYFSNPENEERAVVRYYEAVNPNTLDDIDKVLGCVKLKWAEGQNGDPWVDVIRADAIRGTFQAIPDGVHVLSEAENEAREENSGTWTDRRFYINRFNSSSLDEAYYLPNPDTI